MYSKAFCVKSPLSWQPNQNSGFPGLHMGYWCRELMEHCIVFIIKWRIDAFCVSAVKGSRYFPCGSAPSVDWPNWWSKQEKVCDTTEEVKGQTQRHSRLIPCHFRATMSQQKCPPLSSIPQWFPHPRMSPVCEPNLRLEGLALIMCSAIRFFLDHTGVSLHMLLDMLTK